MSAIFDDFHKVKRSVEKIQREYDQTVGAYQQLKSEMKKEFAISTIKEAEALHEEMQEQELKMSKEYTNAFEDFKAEFGDRLDNAT